MNWKIGFSRDAEKFLKQENLRSETVAEIINFLKKMKGESITEVRFTNEISRYILWTLLDVKQTKTILDPQLWLLTSDLWTPEPIQPIDYSTI